MKKKFNFNTLLRFLFGKVFVKFNTHFLCMTKKNDWTWKPTLQKTPHKKPSLYRLLF